MNNLRTLKIATTIFCNWMMAAGLILSITACEVEVDPSKNRSDSPIVAENNFISKGFPGRALLSFKAKRHLVSFKSIELFPSKLNIPRPESVQSGWTTSGETLLWTPGGTNSFIEIPIFHEKTQGDPEVATYNYLHVDYQELYPDNPSRLFFEMVLDPEEQEENVLIAGGYKHDLEIEESQDIIPSGLTRKGYWYLAKRMLRVPHDRNWVFAQSNENAVFQRRFNKKLKSIEFMDLFFSKALDVSQVKLTLRMGWGGVLKKEDIVYWRGLSIRKTGTMEGRPFLRVGLGELLHQRYKGRKNVTLKEVVVFIPGESGELSRTLPLESILFHKTKTSDRQEDWRLPVSTHTLSQGRKRLELNLFGMVNATGYHPKIKSMRLFVSPQNKNAYSGVRFEGSRFNHMAHIQQPKFLISGEQLNQKWGGPFLTHTADKQNVEWVQVKSYLPFQNIDSKDRYKSGLGRFRDIKIYSDPGALYRLVETEGLLAADLQFYSKDASLSLEFPSIRSNEKDREVTVEWELEGALQLQLLRNYFHSLEGNTTRYLLRKGETPFLKIKLADQSFLDNNGLGRAGMDTFPLDQEKRVSGRIVIKNMKVRDLSKAESFHENKLKTLLKRSQTDKKLKTEERRSIFESKHIPSEHYERSIQGPARLVKAGVSIRAATPIDHWRSEFPGLTLQGESPWLEIDWPVQASLEKNTLFFLGVSSGSEFINSLEIVPTSRGRKLPAILGTVNNPIPLVPGPAEIENLQVRMKLSGGPYKISIEEMSLFQPIVLSREKAFHFPNLVWGQTPLIPENTLFDPKTKSFVRPGNLKAIVASEDSDRPKLSWTTQVQRQSNWIRGLILDYQVPFALHNNNPCWLHLTLVGSRSKADQTVCFDRTQGQVFLPADFLFENFGGDINHKLNSIRWAVKLNPKKGMEKIPLAINLGMVLDGVDILSIYNDLKHQPMFEWNGDKIYPSLKDGQGLTGLFENKGVANFRLFNVSMDSEKNLLILNQDHPHLNTNMILFRDKVRFFSQGIQLQADIEEKEDSERSTWKLIGSMLFILLTAFWLFRFLGRLHQKILSSPLFRKYQVALMIIMATAFYLIGNLWLWSEIIMSLGAIVLVLLWGHLIQKNRTKLEHRWPRVAKQVYVEKGNKYLAGFLVTMGTGALFLLAGMDKVAEHTVNISFFMLVTGLGVNFWNFYKQPSDQMQYHNSPLDKDNIKHA